jgi:hypothetical protein
MGESDIRWFRQALSDKRKKRFVVYAFNSLGIEPPEALFSDLLRAAVYEVNPSYNQYFINPLLRPLGTRRINEELLQWFPQASDFEKAGIANALYWANVPLCFKGYDNWKRGVATPESQAEYDAFEDIRRLRRELFLQEFVRNSNIDVRRSLLPKLDLDASHYSDELKSLISEAIQIARSSDDQYTRARLKVQLNESQLLPSLPHRAEPGQSDQRPPESFPARSRKEFGQKDPN